MDNATSFAHLSTVNKHFMKKETSRPTLDSILVNGHTDALKVDAVRRLRTKVT